jgi:hypothetical protein
MLLFFIALHDAGHEKTPPASPSLYRQTDKTITAKPGIMKKNMSNTDRTVRIFAALALMLPYLLNFWNRTIAVVALVIAGIFLLTSIFGVCPLYSLLGIHRQAGKPKKV